MFNNICKYIGKPELYKGSTNKFWDDEHISKGMLEAHLNPNNDGATRNHKFVKESVRWISNLFPPKNYPRLLDLGCGPGIYAELFFNEGYEVTGIDLSDRSVEYAVSTAQKKGLPIKYNCKSYLDMKYDEVFDVITLIWCDYGALNREDRTLLLMNINKALKPNGVLVFDVFTEKRLESAVENTSYEYYPNGGFWSEEEHLCLNATYLYENSIELRQTIVATQKEVECYNIWEKFFCMKEVMDELKQAGLKAESFYDDIAGKKYIGKTETLCIVARKDI